MKFNMVECLFAAWGNESERLFYDSDDMQLTCTEFLAQAAVRADSIADHVSYGSPVIVQAGRGGEFFVDMIAIWMLGGCVVPVAADATGEYCGHVQNLSDAKVALTNKTIAGCLSIPFGETQPNSQLRQFAHDVDGDDICAILFTSGSTGPPKGVQLSYDSILNNSRGFLDAVGLKSARLLTNIPFNYTSAICYLIACALSGSTLVAHEEKLCFADLFLKIQATNATAFGGAPVQLRWIAETIAGFQEAGRPSDSCLHTLISSGDHLAVDTMQLLRKVAPQIAVYTIYGLTELGGRFCILEAEYSETQEGSVGRPIKGLEVAIHDPETGEVVPVGETGEVVATGSLLCKGYTKNPEATARLLSEYGLRTGDLGHLNSQGFLYLSGRLDDVFKVNGQKVSAVLISEALLATNTFQDVAILPVELPFLGIAPVAVYVLKEGAVFNKPQILAQLRETLPPNHIPQQFMEVEEVPRTGSGKVQRVALKELIQDLLGTKR